MATGFTPGNVLVGAAAMFTQPYVVGTPPLMPPDGQAFSDVASNAFVSWPSPWNFVGASDAGLTLGVQKTTQDIDIEEQSTPVFVAATATAVTVALALAEDTLATMKLSYGGGTITTTAAGTARTVADGVTTASSATVTSATAAFTSGDIGKGISGGSIPVGATILAVASGTSVTISSPATATASGVSITVAATPPVSELVLQEGIDIIAVGFEGRNEFGKPRRILIPQMQVNGQVQTPYRRAAGKRMYPVTFNAICSPTQVRIRNITG